MEKELEEETKSLETLDYQKASDGSFQSQKRCTGTSRTNVRRLFNYL